MDARAHPVAQLELRHARRVDAPWQDVAAEADGREVRARLAADGRELTADVDTVARRNDRLNRVVGAGIPRGERAVGGDRGQVRARRAAGGGKRAADVRRRTVERDGANVGGTRRADARIP